MNLMTSIFYYIFTYLFLAVLGLHHCVRLSLIVASGGHSPAAVHRLLVAVASLVTEPGL